MALCARIPANASKAPADAPKGFAWHTLFERSALPISFVMLLIGAAFSGVVAFLDSFATDIGLTGAAGWFFAVYAAFVFVSPPVGRAVAGHAGRQYRHVPGAAGLCRGLGPARRGRQRIRPSARCRDGRPRLRHTVFLRPGHSGQGSAVATPRTGHRDLLFLFRCRNGRRPVSDRGVSSRWAGFRGTYAILAAPGPSCRSSCTTARTDPNSVPATPTEIRRDAHDRSRSTARPNGAGKPGCATCPAIASATRT